MPTHMANESKATKSTPIWTRRPKARHVPNATAVIRIWKNNEMSIAARNAEASQTAGGHGLVKTILRLRSRKWEDIRNKPSAALKTTRNNSTSLSVPRMTSKAVTWVTKSIWGSVKSKRITRKTKPNPKSRRLRRK